MLLAIGATIFGTRSYEAESALAQSFTVSPHVSSHLSLVCWFLFVVAVLCLGVLFVCCFFVCFASATL